MPRGSVIVLGCGTSTGVPLPACSCPVCTSSDPHNHRCKPCLCVRLAGGEHILIDTPADLRAQALRFKIPRVDAVLYTHAHADHILGLEDLRGYNFIQRRSIPCYTNSQTIAALKKFFFYIFEPDPDYQGGLLPQLTLNEIQAGVPLELCGAKIIPTNILHGRTTVLGFRIGNFGYATDCNVLPTEARECLKNLDVLILDGLRQEPHRTHLSIPESVQIATELGARSTYLTHMTHSVDYEETNSILPAHVRLAYDGLEFEFDY